MLHQIFTKLFGARQQSDDDVLDAYGAVLEMAEMYEPLSKLPASKERIKTAIINRAKSARAEEENALLVAYLSLANFQDSTLAGASTGDLKAALQKDGDDLVQSVLKLGPKFKNMEVLNELVTLERRILAREWEQAQVQKLLTRENFTR